MKGCGYIWLCVIIVVLISTLFIVDLASYLLYGTGPEDQDGECIRALCLNGLNLVVLTLGNFVFPVKSDIPVKSTDDIPGIVHSKRHPGYHSKAGFCNFKEDSIESRSPVDLPVTISLLFFLCACCVYAVHVVPNKQSSPDSNLSLRLVKPLASGISGKHVDGCIDSLDTISCFLCSSKLKKKYPYLRMQDWFQELNPLYGVFHEYVVYPVFDLLASYLPLSLNGGYDFQYSFTELAEAGFKYTNEGEFAKCTGCNRTEELSNFTTNPSSSVYHRRGCKFSDGTLNGLYQGDDSENSVTEQASAGFPSHDEGFEELQTDSEVYVSIPASVSNKSSAPGSDTPFYGAAAKPLQGKPVGDHTSVSAPKLMMKTSDSVTTVSGHTHIPSHDAVSDRSSVASVQQENDDMASEGPQHLTVPRSSQRTVSTCSSSSGYSTGSDGSSGDDASHDARPNGAAASSGWVKSDSRPCDKGFYDSHTYLVETMDRKPNHQTVSIYNVTCQKNKGHYAYFPISSLKMEYLPSSVRNPAFLKLIELMARLTVKIMVKGLSHKRPNKEAEGKKYLIGTGSCLEGKGSIASLKNEDESKWKLTSVKKYLPFHKKQIGEIYIETNRHIVFDDTEAENTTVELVLDSMGRKEIVTVKGVSVVHSDIPGDCKSRLKCRTTDVEVVTKLDEYREEFWRQLKNLPSDMHEALLKRVFILGHPHGGEKVLSSGNSVVIKYLLKSENQVGRTVLGMEKVNNNQQMPHDPEQNVRKVLLYTADTCTGSSGSPILTFKMASNSGDGEISPVIVEPELWMHNGLDTKHELGGSVMKQLTQEDIANHGRPMRATRNAVNQNAGDGVNSFKEQVTGPIFTVANQPAHPAYVAFEKRLDSFRSWTSEHIQRGKHLAEAGFFFAGYADCARCFHCGLGLRTWKPGDDVYVEHHRYKPTCPFLVTQLRAKGITDPERQLLQGASVWELRLPTNNGGNSSRQSVTGNSSSPQAASSENYYEKLLEKEGTGAGIKMTTPVVHQPQEITVAFAHNDVAVGARNDNQVLTVLERENRLLRKQLTCKVCYKKPIKDLFLPCGELYACTECSKLLVNCPSCGKPISATVTTYFT